MVRQDWLALSFLHFSLPAEEVQSQLPEGLEVDLFDGRAYLGLVCFWMSDIRAVRLPITGKNGWIETNVRTYVRYQGEPAIYFFSLDIDSRLAVLGGHAYRIRYLLAEMRLTREQNTAAYESKRLHAQGENRLVCQIGEELPPRKENSLESFLVDRYRYYSEQNGKLYTAQVEHEPYELQKTKVLQYQSDLIQHAGFKARPWEHTCFCEGVRATIGPVRSVRT